MKEKNLRKFHRIIGVVLAIFIVAQAGTGLYFTVEALWGGDSESHEQHEHAKGNYSISGIPAAHANSNAEDAHEHDHESAGMQQDAEVSGNHNGSGHSSPEGALEGEAEVSPGILSILHYSGGTVMHVYRLLLAVGILLQVFTGLWIYKNFRARLSAM